MIRRRILITGASGGIGGAVAKALATPSSTLFLHYYENKRKLQDIAEELTTRGTEVVLVKGALHEASGAQELLRACDGMIDVFVHCAGGSLERLFTETTSSEVNRLFHQHLFSFMTIAQGLLPHMLRQRSGTIIGISSIWGETGAANEVVYSSVKGGMNSFIKALAKEVAPNGIRVNGVAPGMIETSMNAHYSAEELQSIVEDIPASRIGKPEEVADVVSFLCSERSSYVTGQILSVNGGWHC